MKLYRNAIILVVVLGLLAGAYFFINHKKSAAPDSAAGDTTSTNTIKVLTLDQAKINLLEFNNDKGKFSLKKQDKTWTMEPSFEFPVDSSVVDSSAANVASIVADKVIEENASDLGKYGLDKPATIKIGLTDGTSKEIEIGSNNPTNEGTYIKNKGENKVYLIGASTADSLKANRSSFAKKDILPVDAKTLKTFSYEKNGVMQYAVHITSESAMEITAPIKEEAEPSSVSPILSQVVQLAVKDVVDENPADLAKYGLDKPAYSIEYGDGKTTKKILFGNDAEKGSTVYAKFPDGKSVFTISTSPLTFLDVKLSGIVSSFVYIPNISTVNKIDLFIDGKHIISDITTVEGKSDEDKFKVDGKDANMKDKSDNSLFRAFYQAMIGVTMTKYEPGAKPTGTPEITIKYYLKPNSKAVTIDFIPKDSNYYYAMKDGIYTNRVVLKSKFDEASGVRETYKALKKAIDEAK